MTQQYVAINSNQTSKSFFITNRQGGSGFTVEDGKLKFKRNDERNEATILFVGSKVEADAFEEAIVKLYASFGYTKTTFIENVYTV